MAKKTPPDSKVTQRSKFRPVRVDRLAPNVEESISFEETSPRSASANTRARDAIACIEEAIATSQNAKTGLSLGFGETLAKQSAHLAIETLLAGRPLRGEERATGFTISGSAGADGTFQGEIEHHHDPHGQPHAFDRAKVVECLARDLKEARARFDDNVAVMIDPNPGQHVTDVPIEFRLFTEFEDYSFNKVVDDVFSGSYGNPSTDDLIFIKASFEKMKLSWQHEQRFVIYFWDRLTGNSNSESSPTLVQRLERLTEYARAHDERTVRDYAALLLPDWQIGEKPKGATLDTSTLPTEAPEKYAGLRGPETPPAFVKRVYGEWLGHGLTRAHIRQLDPTLSKAIDNWLSKPGNEWPADIDLPTLKEQNTRWADRVGKEGIMSAVEGLSPQEAVRESRRLTALRHRRSKEQGGM